jgi:hypothetical protein
VIQLSRNKRINKSRANLSVDSFNSEPSMVCGFTKSSIGGTTVCYTPAGIHAVWDETSQPEPEIKKNIRFLQLKSNEIDMDEWSEIHAW